MSKYIDVVILRNPKDESIADVFFEDDQGRRVDIHTVFDEPWWDRHRVWCTSASTMLAAAPD